MLCDSITDGTERHARYPAWMCVCPRAKNSRVVWVFFGRANVSLVSMGCGKRDDRPTSVISESVVFQHDAATYGSEFSEPSGSSKSAAALPPYAWETPLLG